MTIHAKVQESLPVSPGPLLQVSRATPFQSFAYQDPDGQEARFGSLCWIQRRN